MAFEREKYVVVKRVWVLELALNSKIAVSLLPNHLSQKMANYFCEEQDSNYFNLLIEV